MNRSNYKIFKEVFSSLGNPDFEDFFADSSLFEDSKFYLTNHSLKPIPYNCVESFVESKFLPGFSIPYALFYFFWKSLFEFENLDPTYNFYPEEIKDGVWLLNEMKEGRFHELNSDQLKFLNFMKIRSNFLENLLRSFNSSLLAEQQIDENSSSLSLTNSSQNKRR